MLAHLDSFSKGQMGNLSPLGVSFKKLCNLKASFLQQPFCKPLWLVPFWALIFKENSKSLFLQKSTKYSLLAMQRPHPPPICLQQLHLPTHYYQRPCLPRLLYLAQHQSQLRFQSAAHCDDFFTH
jgi:hypothetical protein